MKNIEFFTGRQIENRVLGFNPLTDITLSQWYGELQKLALRCGLPEIVTDDMESYKEAFGDGETPEDFLTTEISYASD